MVTLSHGVERISDKRHEIEEGTEGTRVLGDEKDVGGGRRRAWDGEVAGVALETGMRQGNKG